MSPQAISRPHPSPAGDLARLAIPLFLIAGAVAATLWIDRSPDMGAAQPSAVETAGPR